MQHRFRILFLLFSLLALSANSAWACGGHNADQRNAGRQEASEKSCCSKGDVASTDVNKAQDQNPDCPCDHENKGCHCPGCGVVCHAGAALAFDISDFFQTICLQNASLQKQAFYFAQHIPEDVYLSIWQPPKLKA